MNATKVPESPHGRLTRTSARCLGLVLTATLTSLHAKEGTTNSSVAREHGVIQVPAFNLPISSLLTTEERAYLEEQVIRAKTFKAPCVLPVASEPGKVFENMPAKRKCEEELMKPTLAKLRSRYPVQIEAERMAGVYTEIFTPVAGVSRENQNRVLINVHGGGFITGGRYLGQAESVPIASVGRIKVVSVDYRMAPEYKFPAASEDTVAVYQALAEKYKAENIGIYGCSAGALLTAQVVALLQKRQLPLPGAVGLFCAGATYWDEGDSHHIGAAISRLPRRRQEHPYFKGADPSDPLVFPARSDSIMGKFPPSLLISGTRDWVLSPVVYTHSILVRQGVEADLHVWEGMGHAFFFDPDYPQSREAYDVITKFFAKYLGTEAVRRSSSTQ